jgi:SAM-dependent methyltransferase
MPSPAPTLDPSEGRRLYGQDPDAYQAGRPQYPDRVYEVLVDRCGLSDGSRVVEIGPGTGLVTARLLVAGATVTAVEANAAMAEYLAERLAGPDLDIVQATFEEAPLVEGGFDLAVAATSFHWVDQRAGAQKLRRVLVGGGWAAIWWMLFEDPVEPDEFSVAAEKVVTFSPGTMAGSGRLPFQIDEVARRSYLADAGFVDVQSELIRSTVVMDASQIRALYATMAIILRRPAGEQMALLDAIEELVGEEFGGRVERKFVTGLYTARNP